MAVNLQSVEESKLLDPERPIFNVLRATLQYPANPQLRGLKLANDLKFFCKAAGNDHDEQSQLFWALWKVLIGIVSCVPPDHPWQDSLLHCLNTLRQRDAPISGFRGERKTSWKDFPYLSSLMREKWNDPTYTDEDLTEQFSQWKNLNSFVSRLTTDEFALWLNFPIWQLRDTLEEPPAKGPPMDCRLWVASEWIIRCTGIIFGEMISTEELSEKSARSLGLGSLHDDAPFAPLSIERWRLWKKRFSEIAAEADALNLNSSTLDRISKALESMEAVEK